MLSNRLVRLIESHAEELTRDLIQKLKTHPRTPAFQGLSDLEIHNRVYNVYKNLGACLGGSPRGEMEQHYRDLGRRRCEEGIPLHEVVYALILSKKHLLIYARDQGQGGSAIEIYGEQELVNRVDQFYDDALYFTAAGYEAALAGTKPVTSSGRAVVTPTARAS